jgi:hypothetical protein
MNFNPDFDWYSSVSRKNGTTPRCPFAAIQRCPRYYQSLSLLGLTGSNTTIDPKTDKRLLRKWKKTHFWPQVAEQETSVWGGAGKPKGYQHFCPEVVYDNFGYFADSLREFVDEIDMENALRRLRSTNADKNDWRRHFMSLNPIHFTECSLYSLLQTHLTQHEDIFEIKPNFHGIGINLNAVYRRLFKRQK